MSTATSGDAPGITSLRGRAQEVLAAFLRLGCTSFGGPVAHLGYFRAEFVERRRWLNDAEYSQLLALSQFLPGPASSQLGFAIGLNRAGLLGGVAAFVGFTLPSALLLLTLAIAGASLGGLWWTGTVHGLKLVAVVVVADGLWKMARQLTPDAARVLIAAASAGIVIALGSANAQLVALAMGAVVGLGFGVGTGPSVPSPTELGAGTSAWMPSDATSGVALAIFAAMLALALSVGSETPSLPAVSAAFVRAGSLVFGGGHVVLPLLEESVVSSGWLSSDTFLTGYGAAQAVPGPMFSVAAYLGALTPWAGTELNVSASVIGAIIALLSVFAPGFLLVAALMPLWNRVSANPAATRVIAGVNAAVVGLLAAALYDPVLTSGIASAPDVAVVLFGFVLHRRLKRPALWLLLWCVIASLLMQRFL